MRNLHFLVIEALFMTMRGVLRKFVKLKECLWKNFQITLIDYVKNMITMAVKKIWE